MGTRLIMVVPDALKALLDGLPPDVEIVGSRVSDRVVLVLSHEAWEGDVGFVRVKGWPDERPVVLEAA